MKKIILLSLLSVLTVFSCANNSNPPGPEPDPPGPTPVYIDKPIRIVTVDGNGDLVEEITKEYDELYRVIKSEIKNYVYDENIIEQFTYNEHDDVTHFIRIIDEETDVEITYTYDYDDKGNILELTQTGEDSYSKDVYTYDDLNRVLSRKIYEYGEIDPEFVYEYTYTEGKDYKDFEKEEYYLCYYFSDPLEITTQEFDERGNVINKVVYNDISSSWISTTTYIYDKYNCLTKSEYYDNVAIHTIYTASYYDNNPNKPKHTLDEFYEDGDLEGRSDITYTYDTHDRIKTELKDEDDDITTTTYYYEVE